jgi:myo-inositol 2-dehydrogenase/D-chiro-inositol 1-dehydrogenase
MGRFRASALSGDPRTRLVSIFDADCDAARSLATDHSAEVASSAGDAIAAAEAVFICTTADSHADYVSAAAAASRATFCEKPLATDLASATAASRAVDAARVPAMIGFSKRFDPARHALEDQVRSGEIGRVELVLLTNRDPNTTTLRPLIDILRAMHDTAPFGLIRESTVHDFDTARALLGEEPTELHAIGSTLASDEMAEIGEPDTVSVTLRTASGAICHINGCWRTAYGYDQRIEVLGSTGMLQVANGPRPPTVRYDATGAHVGRMYEGPGPNHENWMHAFREAYVAEVEHFVEAVRAGSQPRITIRDGVRAQILVDAAVRSLKTGASVAV